MKNTKSRVWPNRALEVDVEYELRTSAPQEEMERYYRERRWDISPKFNKNEMYFFLQEHPEYRIYATGRWLENQKGEVVGDADTYFHHIMNGGRCDSVWRCIDGWSEQSERTEEIWETLCQHIEELDGLEEIICTEESFGV